MAKERGFLFLCLIHICLTEEKFEAVSINTLPSEPTALRDYGINTTNIKFPVPCCGLFSIFLAGPPGDCIKTIHFEVCPTTSCNGDYVELNGTEIFRQTISCSSRDIMWLTTNAAGVISFGVKTSEIYSTTPCDQIDKININISSDVCTSWTIEKSICSNGTYGERCDLPCGHCLGTACDRYTGDCQNGCELGWDGTNCMEYIDPCATAPCVNGGTCIDIAGTAVCSCTALYTGLYCEQYINPCAANPCFNGGTCNDISGTAVCFCTSLYTGSWCEQYMDPCTTAPCLNGGTCNDVAGTVVCSCTTLYSGPNCEQLVDYGTQPVLLWPLDNTTYTTEILAHPNVSVDKSQCFINFGRPPPGYPKDVVMLDGTRPIDLTVDVPIGPEKDLSFSMLVKPQADTGTMMHFKPNDQTKNFREMLLYMNDGNLVMERVLDNTTKVFNQTQTNVFVDSWYFMTWGIDGSKGTMVLTVEENVYEIDENCEDGIGIGLPGVLRIGGTFDQQQPNFVGSIACVGFFKNLTQPQRADIEPLCKYVMWTPNMPDCNPTPLIERPDITNGYFKKEIGIHLTKLNQIGSSTQCTELRCSLSCLMHSWCWYYHFDSSQTSCQECVLYDSTVRSWLGTGPVDDHLYKWVQK